MVGYSTSSAFQSVCHGDYVGCEMLGEGEGEPRRVPTFPGYSSLTMCNQQGETI